MKTITFFNPKNTFKTLVVLLFFSLQTAFAQTTWYVNDSSQTGDIYCTAVGNNSNAGNTPALPKLTLQAAIDVASNGDTILIDTGNYNAKNQTINKQVTITGAGTAKTLYTSTGQGNFGTISVSNVTVENIQLFSYEADSSIGAGFAVNANQTGIVFNNIVIHQSGTNTGIGQSFVLNSGSGSTISGLIIKCNGYVGNIGGGILVTDATLVINNSIFKEITNSDATQRGGAISISGATSDVTINNSTFSDNVHGTKGGAIGITAGILTVNNSCFDGNKLGSSSLAATDGGGAFYSGGGTSTFNNCSFTNNCVGTSKGCGNTSTPRGGAIYPASGTVNLNTCFFENNTIGSSSRGADIHSRGTATTNIDNCTFNTVYAGNIVNIAQESGTINMQNSGDGVANGSGVAVTNPEIISVTEVNTTDPSGLPATQCISGSLVASCDVTASLDCGTETIAPILRCPDDKVLTTCVLPAITDYFAYDDCSFTVTQSPIAGTVLTGVTLVTLTATDANGNSSTCSFNVTPNYSPVTNNHGVFASAVKLDNGTTDEFYNLTGTGFDRISQTTDFNGNIGSLSTLKITNSEYKSWKNGSGNHCGGKFYYLIYETGMRPANPTFSSFDIGYKTGCTGGNNTFDDNLGPCTEPNDQKWDSTDEIGGPIDLATGLTIGVNYTLEVYLDYRGSDTSSSDCSTTDLINDNCTNFTATFTKVPAGCGASTTRSGGTWSNNAPTISTPVIFAENYTLTGDMSACSVQVNAGVTVTVPSGFDFTVQNAVTVDATGAFIFENNANLLQNTDVANTGNIIMRRNSNPLKRLDYTIWSGPVTGQNLLAFSPLTVTNRFYTYNTATDLYNAVNPSTTSFTTGIGYQIRVPNNHPTTPTIWTGSFTGVPNNGPYTVGLSLDGAGYNMVGNPYPSPIDLNVFDAVNTSNYDGTIYFWRKENSTLTSGVWSTWNKTTFVLANDPGTSGVADPNDIARNGQGFILKALTTTLEFNNSMRVGDNANQFFRNANTIEKNRIWLNLTNAAGYFSQQAFSYSTGGTYDLDRLDAKNINNSNVLFTSLIPNSTDTYVIQSRQLPFDANDIVPLNFKTNAAGTYQIAIDHKDGLFADNTQDIFIFDKYNNTYNNLNLGAFVFNSDAGEFQDRFELRFVSNALNSTTTIANNNNIIAYQNNGTVIVNSGSEILKNVKVFDVRGRLLLQKENINTNEVTLDLVTTNDVLLLKVTTENGQTINLKIIN